MQSFRTLIANTKRTGAAFLGSVTLTSMTLPYVLSIDKAPPATEQDLADPHGAFIDIDGRTIYFVHYPAQGPSLVLVHGFGTSSTSWHACAPLLAAAGFNTYALDLGGFGLSDKPWHGRYGHADQADLVAAWMQELGIGQSLLIGHSMGGNVVAHFALRYPELVSGIVLESAAILSGLVIASRTIRPLLKVRPVRFAARLAVRELIRRSDFSAFEARNPHATRVLRTPDWDLSLLAATRDSTENRIPAKQLRTLDVPTLLVWGTGDTTVPVTDVGKLQMLLPNAQAVILPGLDHLPHEEDPEGFAATVLLWLYNLSGNKERTA